MTKRLVLNKETLARLSDAELADVGAANNSLLCQLTIGGSCGIVCITTPVQCFTDTCPTRGCS